MLIQLCMVISMAQCIYDSPNQILVQVLTILGRHSARIDSKDSSAEVELRCELLGWWRVDVVVVMGSFTRRYAMSNANQTILNIYRNKIKPMKNTLLLTWWKWQDDEINLLESESVASAFSPGYGSNTADICIFSYLFSILSSSLDFLINKRQLKDRLFWLAFTPAELASGLQPATNTIPTSDAKEGKKKMKHISEAKT